jgi:hypothetical protein
VLVRPDGHVGFRVRRLGSDPQQEIESALRALLGRTSEPAGAVAPGITTTESKG